MSEREISSSKPEQELELTLSDEEINFLRNEVLRVEKKVKGKVFSLGSKAIAEANWLFDHPELGMQEVKSLRFLAERLTSILGKEKVGEVGGGVYGILEGDKEDGATIFLRGDMDALFMPDGKPAHMCGHNIHMAWLLENARLLSAYKERFSKLPFKRVVFIGEPNEEGIASPSIGPQEMIKAGLIEKTGQPDFILGAHFAAPQPEGTVRIDKETACYSEGRIDFKFVPRDDNQDVKSIEYEFIYQIGKTWGSEDADAAVGRLRIADNCQSVMPETIVRVTDSKLVSEERRLGPGVLSSLEEVVLDLHDSLDSDEINTMVKDMEARWGNEIEIKAVSDDQTLKITIKSKGGHVAQGGPNVKYIMAELLHNLKEKHNFSTQCGNKAIEIAGSIRTRVKNWQEEGNDIGMKLQEIALQVVNESGARVQIQGDPPRIDIPPVINDGSLRESALMVLQKAKIPITTVGMPIAPAETFVFWEKELNIPGLYIAIGGGDKEELEEIRKNQLPVPAKYLHHAPAILNLIHTNRAIPYGAVLSLIALEIGKQFKKQ